MDFTKLKPALTQKRLPRNGANRSEDLNDFIEQAIHDVGAAFNFLNQTVIPVFNGLGVSGTWDDIDPVANGLDGTTLMVDRDYTDTTSPYFYHSSKGRPKTVFEAFLQVVDDINRAFVGINEVKARLGTNEDDSSTPTSQATLAELETKVNFLNGLVQQIQNANAGYLNAGSIASGLADGTINPTTFNIVDSDVSNNAGILATKVSGIDLTQAYSYAGGVPATYDMADTVQRLKEWLEDYTGETFTQFSGTNVSLSGTPNATSTSHIMASGTGVVGQNNPHGMDITDLSDNTGRLTVAQIIASLDVAPSGNSSYQGGYSYVPVDFTTSAVSLTVGIPNTFFGVVIWKRRAGSNSVLYSGLATTSAPTPGIASASVAVSLLAGDLIFVSGVVGNGLNAKVQVFGRP